MPTAVLYTLTAKRTGVSDISRTVTAAEHAAAGGRVSIDLSGASDGLGGRGKWTLEVTASNAYTPAVPITNTPSTATSGPTVPVTVGRPVAPTGVSVTNVVTAGAVGSPVVTFARPPINTEIDTIYTVRIAGINDNTASVAVDATATLPITLAGLAAGAYSLRIETRNTAIGAGETYTHTTPFAVGARPAAAATARSTYGCRPCALHVVHASTGCVTPASFALSLLQPPRQPSRSSVPPMTPPCLLPRSPAF